MVDVAAFSSFVGGLQAAGGIARSLMGLKITGEVQSKVIELQSVIMAAQSDALTAQQAQYELINRVRELEGEIGRLQAMGAERERYELKDVDRGAFAYVLRPEQYRGEDPYWLCVQCFDSGHKSPLQNQGRTKDNQSAIYGCPKCKLSMHTHWRRKPTAPGGEATSE